jgi:hypothetical protein
VPINLKELLVGIEGKPVTWIDLSDNAYGPTGVAGFDFYLEGAP